MRKHQFRLLIHVRGNMEPAASRCHYDTFPLDTLSVLPEDMRRKIVSLLPTPDAVRMGMVSREWTSICSSLQNLIFEEDYFPNIDRKLEKFIAFIGQMLSHRVNSDIKRFCIKFCLSGPHCPEVKDAWIAFAVEHNVEILDMAVRINFRKGLPRCLFTSQSLKDFRLETCDQPLKLPVSVFLPNLKDMTLSAVIFPSKGMIQKLFKGCPMLERLVIHRCIVERLRCFTVSTPKLKHLEIVGCQGVQMCSISVLAPFLQSFRYDGCLARKYHFGKDTCILVTDINLCEDDENGHQRSQRALIDSLLSLFEGLQHVKSLSMNLFFSQVLSSGYHRLSHHFVCNLQQLDVLLWPTKEHLNMLLRLLAKMPYLKELRITITGKGVLPYMLHARQQTDDYVFMGDLANLKLIDILNFEGLESEMSLVKHLLQSATSLFEMHISIKTVIGGEGGLDQPSPATQQNLIAVCDKLLDIEVCSQGAWLISYRTHHLYYRCKSKRNVLGK